MHTTTLRVTRFVDLNYLCPFGDLNLLVKIVFPAGILQPPFFSVEWYVVVAGQTFPYNHLGQDICHMVHLAWLPPTSSRLVTWSTLFV